MDLSPAPASAPTPGSPPSPGRLAPSSFTPPLYGLDIETDTTADGLDPRVAPVVAAAVATAAGETVFVGPEAAILRRLDRHLRALPPGVVVTWNGSAFDLPFLADRALASGTRLGLVLWPDRRVPARAALPGHRCLYSAAWHHHRHLDAYRLYRQVRLALGVSASLKSVAGLLDLPADRVDASRIHELDHRALEAYVASDARLARLLAERQWHRAGFALDGPSPHAIRPAPALSGSA